MAEAHGSLINRSRAHDLMDEHGVDALIASTPENVTYASDYSAWFDWTYRTTNSKNRESYVVLPADRDRPPALLLRRLDTYLSQWPSWIDEFYSWGESSLPPADELDPEVRQSPEIQRLQRYEERATAVESPYDALATAIADRDLEEATIGLEFDGIPDASRERLAEEFPAATFLDSGGLFRLIRAVKTEKELEMLRRAAEINEQAMTRILNALEVGVTEKEMALLHRKTVTELGAVPDFFNIQAGKRAGTFWEPTNRPIKAGDLVWMDGGCVYERYHSDTGTCAVVGAEPTEEMERWFEIQEHGLGRALETVQAGVSCSDVTSAMYEGMREAGAEEDIGFGHAIGIEPRDLPLLIPPYGEFDDDILEGSMDMTLEPNMVINLETSHRMWNLGPFQIEYTIVVTEDGYETITNQDRRLNVVG